MSIRGDARFGTILGFDEAGKYSERRTVDFRDRVSYYLRILPYLRPERDPRWIGDAWLLDRDKPGRVGWWHRVAADGSTAKPGLWLGAYLDIAREMGLEFPTEFAPIPRAEGR